MSFAHAPRPRGARPSPVGVRARGRVAPAGLALLTAASLGVAPGCLHAGPASRDLQVVDGRLAHSPAVPPQAYAAYLRARLALERGDADLETAARELDLALALAPEDGHLWATKAEILHRMGDETGARAALARARALAPDDPAVRALAAAWSRPGATAARRSGSR